MRLVALAVSIVLLAALSGCVSSSSFERGSNGQSSTHTGPAHFSRSEQWSLPEPNADTHSWDNPFPRAEVEVSGQVGAGRVTITVRDADGDEVYSMDFDGPGNAVRRATTAEGEPGTWTVTIKKHAASGQLAISLTSEW